MNDEKYVFISDTREKKSIANSARRKRTHCGKGGRVKLPSDYLSKKELNAMSGECKSYKLNEPMNWKEFKSMPDDIKISYVKLIREKYGASDNALAEMFGISGWSVCQEMKRLGIAVGIHKGKSKWDKEGFLAWANRVPVEKAVETVEETVEEAVEETEEEVAEEVIEEFDRASEVVKTLRIPPIDHPIVVEEWKHCIPKNGSIAFDGQIEGILKTLGVLLKGADVRLSVHWEVVDNG